MAESGTGDGMHWPVVGRSKELEQIRQFLHDRDCQGLVLIGAAGVGKTCLSRELLHLTGAGTSPGRWLAATRATQAIPFGVLAHLLPGETPDPPDRLQLLQQAQQTMAGLAASSGGVLAVDDAHLLDELSAAAVQRLALDGSVFVVMTTREGETLPDPLASLSGSSEIECLEVKPLDRPSVDELVEAVLDGPVEGRTSHELWRLSRGNPLYLRELVLGARERGILSRHAGMWRHERPFSGVQRLHEVVHARLGQLTESEQDTLEVLAVAEPLGAELLGEVTDAPAVERLEARHLVEVRREGRRLYARTAHPLYGEMLADGLPKLRARRICGRLADGLESRGCRRADDLLRLALWRMESGMPSDPAVLVRAARQALTVFDHTLAQQLAVAAKSQGGGFHAALALAEAIGGLGRLEEAERLGTELVHTAGTDLERTRAIMLLANLMVFHRGDPQVLELLEETAASVADPACRDELEAMLIFAASYLGELPRAIEGGRRFLQCDDPSSGALVRAMVVYTYARPLMAQYEGLDAEIDLGLEAARAHPEAFPLGEHLLEANRSFALRGTGQLDAAEALARQRFEKAIAQDTQAVQGLWATQVAHSLDVRGHAQQAARYFDEALGLLAEHDLVGMQLLVLAQAAHPFALLGDRARVQQLLNDYQANAQGRVPAFGTMWEERARTWLTYLEGDLPEAAEQARHAGAIGLKENLLWFAAVGLHDAVRLGYPELVVEQLADLATRTEGDLIPLFSDHALALTAGDPAPLDAAATRFDAMSLDLYAAEAAAQAAHVHERGTPGHRRACARATQLAERCPGVSTPWLWLERPKDLTPREFEIATMAARGLSNVGISRRLGISPRTVGNHLASVYAKLGATGRNDLPTLLNIDST